MKIIRSKIELSEILEKERQKEIGFVPTMGALHIGHISLLEIAKKENQILVSSLFVNPTQFNNLHDLEIYPRPLDKDLSILEKHGVDYAFVPEVKEIYSKNISWHLDLGYLDQVLEGEKRPGHFQGVSQIVKILFDLVQPNRAYFGQKDYQQFLVIQKLVETYKLKIKLVCCPIIREADGLAMSSRNLHLNKDERAIAPIIFKSLKSIQENREKLDLQEALNQGRLILSSEHKLRVEYLEIAELNSLNILNKWNKKSDSIVLVAVKLGDTRLIDNLIL